MPKTRTISVSELGEHGKLDDAWVVINGTVWDVTEFAPKHPGGVEIITEYLGQDASEGKRFRFYSTFTRSLGICRSASMKP